MSLFNHDWDPYLELLKAQAEIAECRGEIITLQKQLHQTLLTQGEIVQALNNQARSIQSLHAIIKDHIETTYQPK